MLTDVASAPLGLFRGQTATHGGGWCPPIALVVKTTGRASKARSGARVKLGHIGGNPWVLSVEERFDRSGVPSGLDGPPLVLIPEANTEKTRRKSSCPHLAHCR